MSKGAVTIRAAGGVVWRVSEGRVEIAVVQRPRYDDWSLPKGKLEPGESELSAARREVLEEIGSNVTVSRRLVPVEYTVDGARKSVAFWVMAHRGGDFTPNDEVAAVEWLQPKAAKVRLSHRDERRVVADFESLPVPESSVVLVRHARAGKRSEWDGADGERPLDSSGVAQARGLVRFLDAFAPGRAVSASPLRCRQTVEPFAAAAGIALTVDEAFDDTTFSSSPDSSEQALWALAAAREVTVVCSQGGAIPGLIERVARGVRSADTKKAAAWVLSFVDRTVVGADYYEDAPSG